MENLETLDNRFPTQNTSLAAALGALFIMPKKVQPFSVIRSADTGKTTFTYYFELEGSESFCGEVHVSENIAVHWANREKFEQTHPNHPLIPMRKALDSRDWLIRVSKGQVRSGFTRTEVKARISNIILAACVRASGVPLIRYDEQSKEYLFGKVPRDVVEAFEKSGFRNEHPISIMRRCLDVREILIEHIKKCPRAIHYTSGDPASGEFVDCFIPEGMKQDDIDILLARFHSLT